MSVMTAAAKTGAEIAREAADAIRKNVQDGGAIVQRARADLEARPKPKSLPVRKMPSSYDGPPLMEMVEHILQAERIGRWVVAGLGLVRLKWIYEGLDASTGAGWDEFEREYLEPTLGRDRINELIGRMVHRGSLLHCTKCRAAVKTGCACGEPYVGEHRSDTPANQAHPEPNPAKEMTALERAVAAIRADPEKSDRAIAEQIGVHRQTVKRARRHVANAGASVPVDVPVDARVGRDGRRRKVRDRDPEDDWQDPKSYRNAYMLRADQAGAMAFYDQGRIDDEILASAEHAMNAWQSLFQRLTERRQSHGKAGRP